MKEIQSIIEAYDKLDFSQQRAALATVVHVDGSSYRRTGARMLILENGTWIGGISGGCLEGDALRKAKRAILQNKPSLVRYDTREGDAHQIGVGLGCNGLIDVLIAPLNPDDVDNPIEILRSCISDRQANVLITLAQAGELTLEVGTMFKYENEDQLNSILEIKELSIQLGRDIQTAIEKRKSSTKTYQTERLESTFFIEILPPAIHLIIYGGNYDIYPFADLAKKIGWKITVVANPSKIAKSLFSVGKVISNKAGIVEFDEFSAAVLMAHDYKTDKDNFAKIVKTNVPYIGLLGPLKRSDKIFKEIEEESQIKLLEDDFSRIHAPIGLDTGAITPEEISISILAEIRAYFSKRDGGFLKFRKGTIHERSS